MDMAAEELQFLSIPDIVKESISIPQNLLLHNPNPNFPPFLRHFSSLAFHASHSLATPIRHHRRRRRRFSSSSISLLSTAAVVFTVASLYASKPVSFSSTIATIPVMFKRLFITFSWIALLMVAYYIVFLGFLVLLIVAVDTQNVILFIFSTLVVFTLFLGVHVYISALWHLASVVSVLESVYGFAAMKKSYELLKGKTQMGFSMVFLYLAICGVINGRRRLRGVDEDYSRWIPGWIAGDCECRVCSTISARAIIFKELIRVCYVIILVVTLENMGLLRATFRWKTWMSNATSA